MPATLILLPALALALVAWLGAWWYTRDAAKHGARNELQRMWNHAAWLEQRLDTARRERWDHEMIVSVSNQLSAACAQLARAQMRARRRSTTTAR